MDLTIYSSVGTQTPTEERSFEFPECFSPSPPISRSSVSSIATQTDYRRRVSFESPDISPSTSLSRPRLFRRHSTGSDVYNFGSSPTLMTAFGSTSFGKRELLTGRFYSDIHATRRLIIDTAGMNEDHSFKSPDDDSMESVGVQLRRIGDDFSNGGGFRSRSLSLSRFLVNVRRRTSSSSS